MLVFNWFSFTTRLVIEFTSNVSTSASAHTAAQSQDTPFLTAPLVNDFGSLDNQTNVQKVLNGTYECPAELDEFTKQFIKELQQPENLHQHNIINGYTTTQDHITSWKKNKSTYSREHLRAFVLGSHHRSRRREYCRCRRGHRVDPSPHGLLPKALVRCNRRDDTEKGSIQARRKTPNHCVIPFPLQHAQPSSTCSINVSPNKPCRKQNN
jgi:hypothetical protein